MKSFGVFSRQAFVSFWYAPPCNAGTDWSGLQADREFGSGFSFFFVHIDQTIDLPDAQIRLQSSVSLIQSS